MKREKTDVLKRNHEEHAQVTWGVKYLVQRDPRIVQGMNKKPCLIFILGHKK
jgi:hypothetical protein